MKKKKKKKIQQQHTPQIANHEHACAYGSAINKQLHFLNIQSRAETREQLTLLVSVQNGFRQRYSRTSNLASFLATSPAFHQAVVLFVFFFAPIIT